MAQKTNTHIAPPCYDETFKQDAIRMVTDQKRPIKEVASDLEICTDTLKKWLRDAEIQPTTADHGNRDAQKIRILETENRVFRKSLSEKDEAPKISKTSVVILSRP
ncbi:transposase [Ethanoligenens sp.]|uniref:transposase n=1 Tax=Ethanoligenens sp. TaxID=2099655 RepID=UPI0039EBBC3D